MKGRVAAAGLILLAGLCVVASSACAETVVRIAHIASYTGPLAILGHDGGNGAKLAVQELNERRLTLQGAAARFELIQLDDGSDPKRAVEHARRLCEQKVNAVIGPFNASVSAAVTKVFSQCGIPIISPSPKADTSGFKTAFRIVPDEKTMTDALVRYAASRLLISRVITVEDRTPGGRDLAEEFKRAARGAGITVVDAWSTPASSSDFSGLTVMLKAQRADAIYLTLQDQQAVRLLRQLERERITNVPILVADVTCTEELGRLAQNLRNGRSVVCATPHGDPESTARGRDWRAKYEQQFPKAFQGPSASTYDAVMMFAEAMRRAGSADPRAYSPALRQIEYRGITGIIQFNANGELVRPPVTLSSYSDTGRRMFLSQGVGDKP